MKTCVKCKLKKSETDFYLRGETRKRRTACKKCHHARNKVYYAENREEIRANQKGYRKEHREEFAAYMKNYYAENLKEILAQKKVYNKKNREKMAAYRKENRERTLARIRLNKYGVTSDDLKRILAKQGGVCAICGSFGGGKRLCVDHDHETGKVRGLLCQSCNKGIGLFKDSSVATRRASDYLKQHGK